MLRADYTPPWADTSIIGIAGSSGSGKTSLALEIVSSLNRPWVLILSMDSYYKYKTPEQIEKAFRNEYDLDAPDEIDFDKLVENLRELKKGKKTEIPIYSFKEHKRQQQTTTLYSPHVLILEGIFALYDPRVLDMLDVKIFVEADADLCLARRLTRDVLERGRDLEGIIKQWFAFVKPNAELYVNPQRKGADILVPRGIDNKVAIDMVAQHVQRILMDKSVKHRAELKRLGQEVEDEPLSPNVLLMKETPQLAGMNTIIQDQESDQEDFIFYFDRLSTLLIESALEDIHVRSVKVETPQGTKYQGLQPAGETSAVIILRGGSAFEPALKRVIPDCRTGRILIQSSHKTGEPELHYRTLPADISTHDAVLLLDPQMSSGGAALMAVKVLVDHGVKEENIVLVTYFAGKVGLNRLSRVFPEIKIVVGRLVGDEEERWVEKRYFGC
ncbi:MAG: Uridine kinase [Sclerophora amabilis]|nr:MAG: Uridine kinase [Sclerophora amabilis]